MKKLLFYTHVYSRQNTMCLRREETKRKNMWRMHTDIFTSCTPQNWYSLVHSVVSTLRPHSQCKETHNILTCFLCQNYTMISECHNIIITTKKGHFICWVYSTGGPSYIYIYIQVRVPYIYQSLIFTTTLVVGSKQCFRFC